MSATGPVAGTCPVCDQRVLVVNHGREGASEVGYLARHGRPGIARTSKCRGSWGPWREKEMALLSAGTLSVVSGHRRRDAGRRA